MKMKFNFSGAGIAGFFVDNGEKIVLGIMVLVLLSFLYGAITARPLDDSKSPESIVRESDQAKKRVNEVDFKDSGETVSATDFKKLIAEDRKEVPMAKLQQSNEWDPRLFPELTKRGEPEIYSVGELQIASGYALVPYARGDASGHSAAASASGSPAAKIAAGAALPGVRAAGADVRPVYYTILTGVVPVEKEELEYKRRFEYAVKPNKPGSQPTKDSQLDEPQYFFFQAERAEVTDAKDANPKWVDLDWLVRVPDMPDGGKPNADKWAATYGEIVDSAYVFQPATTPENTSIKFYVTWPLPPVYLKYWGLEAGHPKVPFFKPEGQAAQPEQPADSETPSNPFGIIPGIKAAVPGSAAGKGPAGGKAARAPVVAPKSGGGARSGAAGHSEMAAAANAGQYRLFRFVDMTAESGKTYRYRVRLILANPNYNVKPEDLERPESAKTQWRLSPWSEASPTAIVPREARVLADSLVAARGGADPQAKIYILTLLKDEKTGAWVEVAKDFDLPLGGYATYSNVKIENVTDMTADEVRTIVAPTINADQAMLLDIRNDDALGASKSKSPTEMLLIDSTGRIRIANSAVDSLVLKDYQQRTTAPMEAPPR